MHPRIRAKRTLMEARKAFIKPEPRIWTLQDMLIVVLSSLTMFLFVILCMWAYLGVDTKLAQDNRALDSIYNARPSTTP